MGPEVIHSAGPKRVRSRVVPDVGSRASMSTQLDIVAMRPPPNREDANQLVLAAVERALASVRLHPDSQIDGVAIHGLSGRDQFGNVAPIHAHVVNRAFA